jgi:hypothetical protein
MKLTNIRPRQVIAVTAVVLVAFYIIKMMKKPEDYEGEDGPSTKEKPKITAEDLKSVLKFIG